jgi:F-type H+-transporting ATPase subunit delta
MAKTAQEKAELIVLRALSLLAEEDRLIVLPLVIRKLQKQLELYANQGEIISAVPLEKDYVLKIEQSLEKKLGEKIALKNRVDKKILGGFIVRFHDLVIDQSLKRQLTNLKGKVNEN